MNSTCYRSLLADLVFPSSLLGHNLMVLEMLGPNLDELMLRCGGVFSVRTVALIGLQLMDRIEFLHSHGILYRDIKGENLLIGLFDHHNRVYLVDFGLCKNVLKEDGVNYTPVGTPRYMSLRTHEGKASTYRDDVESIGYLLIYFCLGRLPWQGLPAASTNSKIAIIAQKKMATSLEELCKGLPVQLIYYFEAARKLEFNEFPNYNYFRQLLRIICKNFNADGDRYLYDWQRPGIKLTVFPKISQPTAISQKHDVMEQNVVDLRPASREWRSAFAGRPHGDGVASSSRKMRKGSLGVLADAVGSTSSSLFSQPRQTSLLSKKKFTRF
ncbi:hypothetical protein RvY_01186 [Ramazzottius varieornatus]|uniref:non-specific serine/threonine protein kinase n=1 Tax=Ramazzottius varieornatus TaxID=947166 RepID=A0A1D1UQS7_RAMVA|nr:hypothetical protein RvY_01186 [Ramazzottius varieornatus]